ncbi:MAG: hypothetical protein R6V03_00860 [Kiritimatiellia bacterium]
MTDTRRSILTGAVLLACIGIVIFWEIMAYRSELPREPFELTAEDFADFHPHSARWTARRVPVSSRGIEPNIAAFEVRKVQRSRPVLVRLVHGYNMPDCMRIKGYKIGLISSRSSDPSSVLRPLSSGFPQSPSQQRTRNKEQGTSIQLWSLTNSLGDVSVWATAMIEAEEFRPVDVDIRSMAFPRIGTPDNPDWTPRGLTAESLDHPVKNFREYLNAKWNNSRCDPGTFLKLKRPAWASGELLTLVAASKGRPVKPGETRAAAREVTAALKFMHGELVKWKKETADQR